MVTWLERRHSYTDFVSISCACIFVWPPYVLFLTDAAQKARGVIQMTLSYDFMMNSMYMRLQ